VQNPRYNIRAVERLTGIPAPTLRSWERRYGFPAPARTPTARRLYTDDDIRAITWVREQTERGLSAAQAIAWARSGGDRLGSGRAAVGPPTAAALARALVEAAGRYDEAGVEAALSTAFAHATADDVLLNVITPALVEVGEAWARDELPVAAEHFVSNLVRRRLLGLLAAQPAIAHRMTAALACLPNEQHEIGLLMLALFLRWAGVRVLYLGADLPVQDLVRLAETREIDAIGLSGGREAAWEALPGLVTGLARTGRPIRIYLGGAAANDHAATPGITVLTGDLRAAATVIASGGGIESRT
jgi:methanogenic corrinoid protein MtbC1